jgi:hypothetical protein
MLEHGVPNESKELPAELMGRPPRRVRLTGTGWFYALAWAFLFLLGVGFAVRIVKAANQQKTRQHEMQQSGGVSSGQITGKWIEGFAGGYLSYSFAVDGATYSGKAKAPIEVWDSLREGESLPVRYLQADPNFNHPAAWQDSQTSILWAALFFPGFLVFFSFLLVWRFPSQCRLAIEGIPAWASIAEREWRGPSRGQNWESYTFRNADNEVQFGKCPMDVALKAGSTVCVLYLPANPSRSAIYPLDFFEVKQ